MRTAVNNLQKNIFTVLLYLSAFAGLLTTGKTGLYVLYDVMIIFLALLSLSYLRGKLAWIVIFIMACFIFNMSYSGNTLMYSLNGIREIAIIIAIVIYFNKVFSDNDYELIEDYLRIFKRFAFIFLAAQVPVAFYQFSMHGASDQVGGTYGNYGSGVLTLSITCLVFFMSHFTTNMTQRALLYFCLCPMLLNETKVSFILIPVLILFIHFQPKIKNVLIAVGFAALFLVLFNRLYTSSTMEFGDDNISGIFSEDFLDYYLMGDIYVSEDVPRFTKIIVAWQLLAEQVNTFLFGFEYGMFKGGTVVETSHFASSILWLLSGTRPYLFFLLMQGGLFLVVGIFMLVFYANKFFSQNNNKFKTFLFLVFLLILFYNDALRNQNFVVLYFFNVFFASSDYYNREKDNLNSNLL